MNNVLLEYLLLVLERSNLFSFEKFKKLRTFKEQAEYAEQNLMKLGQGSSRISFFLTSKKVIKIARNEVGVLQNKVEANLSTTNASSELLAEVYDFDIRGNWIIMELVRPIDDVSEFESLTGIDHDQFMEMMEDIYDKDKDDVTYDKNNVPKFVKSIVKFIDKNNLIYNDIVKLGSWGKSASNKAVLFDYGLDKDTLQAYRKK